MPCISGACLSIFCLIFYVGTITVLEEDDHVKLLNASTPFVILPWSLALVANNNDNADELQATATVQKRDDDGDDGCCDR